MAEPTPKPSTVTLQRGDETITVPEAARLDLEKKGYSPVEAPEPELSTGDKLLGLGEAFGRGTTLGAASVVSDTLAGAAGALAGPDVARVSGPGLDAELDERSDFRRAYEQNALERNERREGLGAYATAAEIAGGMVPVLLSGGAAGAGLAARAVAASPAALAERAGVAAAAKLLGREAVTVGARAAQLAVQAGVEGAIAGAGMGASESIPTALEDPSAAAQEVLLQTGLGAGAGAFIGGGLGAALGGAGGLIDGVLRRADPRFQKQILDSAAPAALPEPKLVPGDELIQANATRPLTADLVVDTRVRGSARKVLDGYQALTGGLDNAVEEGTRRGQNALDQFEDLRQRFEQVAGVQAKNRVNELALSEGFANRLTDVLDDVDVADVERLRGAAESARKIHLDLDASHGGLQTSLATARESEAAARTRLDDLLAPKTGEANPKAVEALEAARAAEADATAALEKYRTPPTGEGSAAEGFTRVEGFTPPKPKAPLTANEEKAYQLLRDASTRVQPGGWWAKDTDRIFIGGLLDQIPEGQRDMVRAVLPDLAQKKMLRLARADLVQAMDPAMVAKSETSRLSSQFHFVEADSLGARFSPGSPAAAPRLANEIDPKELAKLERKLAGAKRAVETAERRAAPGKLPTDAKAVREAREALAETVRARKALEKDLETTSKRVVEHGEAALTAESELASRAAPRRLTEVEVASRQMFDGLLSSIDDQLRRVGGREADNVANFRAQVNSYREAAIAAMRRGDFGTAHQLMDQGLKHAIADVATNARTTAVREYAKAVYNVPRSFMENADVWGTEIAGRNIAANPSFSAALAARQDAGFRSLFAQGGEANVDGWGARRVANSASIKSLMQTAGDAGTATSEAGARQALRAQVEDFATRSKAWGGPESKELAELAARAQTQFEDLLDHAAIVRRDATSAKQTIDSLRTGAGGLLVATGAGAALGMGGAAVAAVPLIAGKWFLSAMAKGKGDLGARMARGLANGVLKAGHTVAPVVRSATRSASGALAERERRDTEETVAEARALTQPDSPQLGKLAADAERLNAVSPGLGDAVLEQRFREANYIVSKLPQPPSAAVFSPPPRATDAAARQMDRIVGAIRNPDKTFEKIYTGVATAEEMDAMRKVYPAVYARMVDTIMQAVSAAPERVKSTRTKMYLSRVTGQPLTPALMKLSSSQARARAATESAEAAGGIQGEGANGSNGVTPRANMMEPDSAAIYGNRSDVITSKGAM